MKKPTNKVRLVYCGVPCPVLGPAWDKIVTIRASELPVNAVPTGQPRWYEVRRPSKKPIFSRSPHAALGRKKVAPRGGLHRHYHTTEDIAWHYDRFGPWIPFVPLYRHADAKRAAHRTARRKARQYFRTIDLDGDYNAKISYGLTSWDFS